jgi:hypothetical protein
MVARILGADVVLTEQNKLVRLMNENIARNFGVGGSPAIGIRAFPLNWSEEGARAVIAECCDNSRGFDLVLSCDCVYAPLYGDSWRQLITCLRILLLEPAEGDSRPNRRSDSFVCSANAPMSAEEIRPINCQRRAIIAVERRTSDGVDDFLSSAREQSLVVKKVFEGFNISGRGIIEIYKMTAFETLENEMALRDITC